MTSSYLLTTLLYHLLQTYTTLPDSSTSRHVISVSIVSYINGILVETNDGVGGKVEEIKKVRRGKKDGSKNH
jgi:hypothetical protein